MSIIIKIKSSVFYTFGKRKIRNLYRRIQYLFLPKIKYEGDIERISPKDKYEYFFGYYDKSPWDITDRYMLCLRVKKTWKNVAPKEEAELILIDTKQSNKIYHLAFTKSWNVQQGCMLQWLGPDYKSRVIYNDYRNGKFCSVILKINIEENNFYVIEEKEVIAPIYSVSTDGTFALTLDFTRLNKLRPGYGYSNAREKNLPKDILNETCIWIVDIRKNIVKPILKYSDFYNFEYRPEMNDAVHKVNHIMLSPNNKRFMVLHRWIKKGTKYSRLITCDINGTNMYNLSDDNMVSHCFWKNSNEILAFENKNEYGPGYYLMEDKTNKYIRCWDNLNEDGHPSYSFDKTMIVTDTYPNIARLSDVKIMNGSDKDSCVKVIARVYSPFKYNDDVRCDLHPRWNHKNNKICIDSVYDGKRGLYVIDINDIYNQM